MKSVKSASKAVSLLSFLLIFLAFHSPAQAITIDGQLNDWGVSPAAFGSTDWTPFAGIASSIEDHDPKINFINPGWGGQLYDAEALYFKREGMLAQFAMVTGLPWPGDGKGIVYGDFAFDFDSDGSYEFGLETRGNNGFQLGHLYGNPTWDDPFWTVSTPYDLLSGTDIGAVNYAYNKTSYVAHQHYVIEFSVPISFFGSFWNGDGNPEFTLHWTMSCGNDAIDLYVPGTTTNVPEPGTMALLGLGLAGWKISRRRKSAKN